MPHSVQVFFTFKVGKTQFRSGALCQLSKYKKREVISFWGSPFNVYVDTTWDKSLLSLATKRAASSSSVCSGENFWEKLSRRSHTRNWSTCAVSHWRPRRPRDHILRSHWSLDLLLLPPPPRGKCPCIISLLLLGFVGNFSLGPKSLLCIAWSPKPRTVEFSISAWQKQNINLKYKLLVGLNN